MATSHVLLGTEVLAAFFHGSGTTLILVYLTKIRCARGRDPIKPDSRQATTGLPHR